MTVPIVASRLLGCQALSVTATRWSAAWTLRRGRGHCAMNRAQMRLQRKGCVEAFWAKQRAAGERDKVGIWQPTLPNIINRPSNIWRQENGKGEHGEWRATRSISNHFAPRCDRTDEAPASRCVQEAARPHTCMLSGDEDGELPLKCALCAPNHHVCSARRSRLRRPLLHRRGLRHRRRRLAHRLLVGQERLTAASDP